MRPKIRELSTGKPPGFGAGPGGAKFGEFGGRPKRSGALSWLTFCMFLALIALFIPPDLGKTAIDAKEFGAPDATLRIIKFSLLGLGMAMILGRWRESRLMLKAVNSFFVAYIVLIVLSLMWSIEKSATTARFVALFTVVVVSFSVILVNPNRQRLQQVARPILTIFLSASLVVGMIWPDLVLEKGDDISLKNAWHGLASQKNEFGQLGSFGVIFWFHTWLTREVNRIYAVIGIGIAAWCVLLSRSSTSLFATIFALGMMVMLQRAPPSLRRYRPYLIGSFFALLITYAIAELNLVPGLGMLLEPVAAATGKDLSFSGRAQIWQIIKEHIQLSPFLGSGYGAYWVGPVPTSPSYVFLARLYLYPTESHNGYIEVTNDLGFVGLLLLLGYLITYVRQCLSLMKFDRAQAALYVAILFQQIILNLSEACWITARSVSSNMMILATMALGSALLEQRRQTQLSERGRLKR
jgi:exopolysaccharide production protein ExoQ